MVGPLEEHKGLQISLRLCAEGSMGLQLAKNSKPLFFVVLISIELVRIEFALQEAGPLLLVASEAMVTMVTRCRQRTQYCWLTLLLSFAASLIVEMGF